LRKHIPGDVHGNGCDCIHALTDQDPLFSRNRYPLRRFGNRASEFIVKEVWRRGLLIQPAKHNCFSPTLHAPHAGRRNNAV
jgi:hypothetical protein